MVECRKANCTFVRTNLNFSRLFRSAVGSSKCFTVPLLPTISKREQVGKRKQEVSVQTRISSKVYEAPLLVASLGGWLVACGLNDVTRSRRFTA